MRATGNFILAPASLKVEVRLEPAFINFESLSLLSSMHYLSGLNQWIVETASAFSAEDRHRNDMLFMGFWGGFCPTRSYPDFPSYVDDIASREPQEIMDELIRMTFKEKAFADCADAETFLSDLSAYLNCVEAYHNTHIAEKGLAFDRDFYTEIFYLLRDPYAAKEVFVAHLRKMWEKVLAPEWQRNLPLLRQSVDAFQQYEYSGSSVLEAVREVTGRDLSSVNWDPWGEHIIFVPSPHIAPYVSRYSSADDLTNWLIFGVRLPEGSKVYEPAFSRSELTTRLNALADDTRLRIMELFTQHEELCAQDIMVMLELSQSAASRHLRQLTANGYLIERRQENAKCYMVNKERFESVIDNLRRFLHLS